MGAKYPIRVKNTGTNAQGLQEFLPDEFVPIDAGGTGGITVSAAKTALGFVSVTDIINNLTSILTDQPLSAAQGKVLKDLIDGLSAAVISFDDTPTAITAATVQAAIVALDSLIAGLGVDDHGSLTGLGDDDHSQYHTDTRGDIRYYTKTLLNAGQLDTRYYTETEVDDFLSDKQDLSEKNANNGYAGLNASGKLSNTVIPDLAITDFLGEVANETAMLLLSGQNGDWCIRLDTGTVFVLTATVATVLANWKELSYPVAPVTTVNGQTGVVVLDSDDISEGGTNLYLTSAEKSKLSGIEPNAKNDQDADEVPYTPSGSLTSEEVQGALDELIAIADGHGGVYLDRQFVQNDVADSNTSLTQEVYVTKTFTALHAANYRVTVIFQHSIDDIGALFVGQLTLDGNVVSEVIINSIDKLTNKNSGTLSFISSITAASHTYAFQYAPNEAGREVKIHQASLSVERFI